MDRPGLEGILEQVRSGKLEVSEALAALEALQITDVGFARIDNLRELRTGVPEVIYAEGKTSAQTLAIALEQIASSGRFLATRVDEGTASLLCDRISDCVYLPGARIASLDRRDSPQSGNVTIVTAGTSDLPVAEEAQATLEFLGSRTELIPDVGVAGLHRLLSVHEQLAAADVIIVVAGMEAALASAVGGLVRAPVIAVPTSVGYGASFEGLAALLGMLTCCAPGVSVVNIDNGFGAACVAWRIIEVRTRAAADKSS